MRALRGICAGFFGLLLMASPGVAGQDHAPSVDHAHGQRVSNDERDWPMYNHDVRGSRFNAAEHRLNARNVKNLAIEWQYAAAGPVHATPVVVGSRIYAGDVTGLFHALQEDGTALWATQLDASVISSALVSDRFVFVGTSGGAIYALGIEDGAIAWHAHPNPHSTAEIQGSPILVAGKLIVPITSGEEFAASDPTYPCCSARGSLAALDPDTGNLLWQKFTISEEDSARGSAGAGVWGTPTYDPESERLYIGTGQNYSDPATSTSDSVWAIDVRDGATIWQTQVTRDDVWNIRLPIGGQNQDGDFGDSPKIYRLPNGRQVLALGQKTGAFWIFDAKTGHPLARRELLPGGVLGGFQTGCAHAYGINLTNGVNWPDLFADPNNPSTPPAAGAILALSSDQARELWRFEVPGSPFVSGVAVAGGVVYGVASGDGKLYALDAKTGRALATVALGPAVSGPSISRGHVYVGTGNQLLFSLPTSDVGTITALGVDAP